MSDFVKIQGQQNVVEPATEEKVYDHYWVRQLQINAFNPQNKVRANAILTPARNIQSVDEEGNLVVDEEGNPVYIKELKQGSDRELRITDVFGDAANDPTLAVIMNNLLTYIKDRALAEGLI